MSGKHENKLLVFERAALRRMLGLSGRDKICNVDIRERLGVKKSLLQNMYQRQHTWLGHARQMNNGGIAKSALEGKVEGKRRVNVLEPTSHR